MNSRADSPIAAIPSPLGAFSGPITRSKPGPLYSVGLAIVAFAMVLLPLIYIGLIALTGWLIVLHLKHDAWIFGSAGGFLGIVFYLGPAVAGIILVVFMVKPFFAGKAKLPDPITLNPASETLLFSFVQKICDLVGAPVPCRIDVDCQVNASARLRDGVWSRDLVLTIGLPLASGLNMREFAGVLAHEFGHFAQGAGMRLTYVIQKINLWFARVVYERDAWDVQLEANARDADWRIAIVLHAARVCVFLTRRALWLLMQIGHAISCFMLRQMEYDADSYGARVAGSDTIGSIAARLRLLNFATQAAYEDVRQSWASNRLPENLPLLIQHKFGALPQEVHEKLSASALAEKTGWFDTHPCDDDRVRAVQRLKHEGVFHLTQSAVDLFSDFAALSKIVTQHQYHKLLRLQFTEKNLMPADEILRESAASVEADAMIRKYFGTVNPSLTHLLAPGQAVSIQDDDAVLARWREARDSTESLRSDAEQISNKWADLQQRRSVLISASLLAKAGFRFNPADVDLPENATSPAELEHAAGAALSNTTAGLAVHLANLTPFIEALRRRLFLDFQAGLRSVGPAAPDSEVDPTLMLQLAAVVGSQMWRAHEIGAKLGPFIQLARNRASNSIYVDEVVSELLAELKQHISAIQDALKNYSYPFPHARGRLTVAEYARGDRTGDDE